MENNSSIGSISSGYHSPTPRRSITPAQAIDELELGITQANDLQHLFQKFIKQISHETIDIRLNIDNQFDQIIQQLLNRKDMLHEKVNAWKSEKMKQVNDNISNAAEYEQILLNAQKQCNDILRNKKLDSKQKKNQIKSIKNGIIIDEKYRNSTALTKHINNFTKLIDIDYQKIISFPEVSQFGNITFNKENNSISVPMLTLSPPFKGRESKNGYKLKLKWTVSHPLIADNFIIRCLTLNNTNTNKNKNDEMDEKQQEYTIKRGENRWKSLIFEIKQINKESTKFEAVVKETTFLFDKTYMFRVEYHITDPVNLLIGSNEEQFQFENLPPSSNKAEFIELEYFSSRGFSYEGHPKYLFSENKLYRSKPNKDFHYNENDWIVFKLKHSGYVRTYLPKAVVVKNCSGTQALRELMVSIGSKGDGKEWLKYNIIRLESNADDYQQMLLDGVDWKTIKQMKTQYIRLEFISNHGESRGAQCRFKVNEFQLYGLEFK